MDLMMTRRQALVGMAMAAGMMATANAALADEGEKTGMVAQAEDTAGASPWQGEVSFPDWMGTPS